MDVCANGKCYDALSTMFSALQGNQLVTSNCDILESLYQYGEFVENPNHHVKGDQSAILARVRLLLDIIGNGINV